MIKICNIGSHCLTSHSATRQMFTKNIRPVFYNFKLLNVNNFLIMVVSCHLENAVAFEPGNLKFIFNTAF